MAGMPLASGGAEVVILGSSTPAFKGSALKMLVLVCCEVLHTSIGILCHLQCRASARRRSMPACKLYAKPQTARRLRLLAFEASQQHLLCMAVLNERRSRIRRVQPALNL